MTNEDLASKYRRYIDLCNKRGMDDLSEFVHDELTFNDKPISRIEMQKTFGAAISSAPDFNLSIEMLLVDGDMVASRMVLTSTPEREFHGLQPTGRTMKIREYAFYRFEKGKIRQLWMMLDTPSAAV
ncbi:putative ubiquitin-protein ligase sel1 protein [Lasiodiplodia theobromae]|uniref:Ester cyclase n=1 Tax=Lasiodiplodia theobromae TaxID=45133 RepID=A0A5N5CYG5_9PEZI|nr:Ubiquitin-protein ligase sel1 protein [Lasiodiplodia theobromae]KAB2570407.1 hypothetical protein DBV05_g10914 [Lasiodiplodia theobromae]KAF4543027.1 Ubiquitin-protein ligase sel1 protein [Lasiodiplodia theobromae]KAF9635601.1 putative ubiquitin-protein ligase sel1 protein [Lasiodiplodia theobromae]